MEPKFRCVERFGGEVHPKASSSDLRWAEPGSLRDGYKNWSTIKQNPSFGEGDVRDVSQKSGPDSTKATTRWPRWHTCSHVGHRQIPPPWRKEGDQNHAEPKGALEIQSGSLRLAKHKQKLCFGGRSCAVPILVPTSFFLGAVKVSDCWLQGCWPSWPKSRVSSLQLLFLFVEYEKSLPSLQGRLLPEVLDVVTHQLVGVKYNPSETIHFRSILYPVISPKKTSL